MVQLIQLKKKGVIYKMAKTSTEKPKLPYAGRGDTIKIFKLIHERKEPAQFNNQKLKTHGIGSPVHVIAMLKTLGFINDDGILNSSSNDLRGTPGKFKECLEGKVRDVYKDLFNTVKDSLNPESEVEVRNYFRNHVTDVRGRMLQIITTCFLTLRDIINSGGNFESLKSKQIKPKEISAKPKEKANKIPKSIQARTTDSYKSQSKDIKIILNVNINLDIGTSKEAIEELFKNISSAKETVFGENK